MTVGIGVVGFGKATRVFHGPLISYEQETRGRARLAAIASARPDAVREFYADVPVVSDINSLIQRDDIDLIVVASASSDHFEHARTALSSGKHVVLEKPMTVTAAEADQLIALADQNQLLLTAFHNRRWDNATLALEQVLASEALGRVATCNLRFEFYRPEATERWRDQPLPGSGLTYDLASHLLYSALTLFGPPQSLIADISQQRPASQVDDYFLIALDYGPLRVNVSGAIVVAAPEIQVEAHGSAASFLKYSLDPQERLLAEGLLPNQAGWTNDPSVDYAVIKHPDGRQERIATPPGHYELFYAGVVDAVLGTAPSPVPATRARNVIALIEAALLSSGSGRRVACTDLLIGE